MTEIQKISFDCSNLDFQKAEKSAATTSFLISSFLWVLGIISCLNMKGLNELAILTIIIFYSSFCIFSYFPLNHFLLRRFKVPTLQIEFLNHSIAITNKENNAKQTVFNNTNILYKEVSQIQLLFYSHIAVEKTIKISISTSSMKYSFVCFISSEKELSLFLSVLKSLYAKGIHITEKDADGNTLFLLQKTLSKDMEEAHYISLINQIGIKTADEK